MTRCAHWLVAPPPPPPPPPYHPPRVCFLDLPAEIRERIYDYAMTYQVPSPEKAKRLRAPSPEHQGAWLKWQGAKHVSYDAALLYVNRQIHEEAKYRFYRENMFTLVVVEVGFRFMVEIVEWRLSNLGMPVHLSKTNGLPGGVAITARLTLSQDSGRAEPMRGFMVSRYDLPALLRELRFDLLVGNSGRFAVPSTNLLEQRIALQLHDTFNRNLESIHRDLLEPWTIMCPFGSAKIAHNENMPQPLALKLQQRLMKPLYGPLLKKIVERSVTSTETVTRLLKTDQFHLASCYAFDYHSPIRNSRGFHLLFSQPLPTNEDLRDSFAILSRCLFETSINTVLAMFLLERGGEKRVEISPGEWDVYDSARTTLVTMILMPTTSLWSRVFRDQGFTELDRARGLAVLGADEARQGQNHVNTHLNQAIALAGGDPEFQEFLGLICRAQAYAVEHGWHGRPDLRPMKLR